MSIRKSRSQNPSNLYLVDGREFMVLNCRLPNGETVGITIQVGATDVNGREYVSIDAMFNPASKVEFSQDMPQIARIIVRTPGNHEKT